MAPPRSRSAGAAANNRAFGVIIPRARIAANHTIHEPYGFRYEDTSQAEMLPISPARDADTLERLSEVFQRPEIDFIGVNPEMRSLVQIASGTSVKVPDPGLTPLFAVHLAARTLAAQSLGTDRARLIRLLVPAALQNATALDTVLRYLLLASALKEVDILERVVKETGPRCLQTRNRRRALDNPKDP
jgi:hypothetical protein